MHTKIQFRLYLKRSCLKGSYLKHACATRMYWQSPYHKMNRFASWFNFKSKVYLIRPSRTSVATFSFFFFFSLAFSKLSGIKIYNRKKPSTCTQFCDFVFFSVQVALIWSLKTGRSQERQTSRMGKNKDSIR